MNNQKKLSMHFGAPYTRSKERPWALVLGATGSIGLEVCETLFTLGFSVICCARSSSRLAELRSSLMHADRRRAALDRLSKVYDKSMFWNHGDSSSGTAGPELCLQVVDLAVDPTVAADAVQRGLDQFITSKGSLHIMCCCAGAVDPVRLADADDETLVRTLNVELTGTMLCVQRCARDGVLARGAGSVVLVTSTTAMFSGVYGQTAYAAASSGKHGLADALFEELRLHGVRVCSLLATDVNTPMVDSLQQHNLNSYGAGKNLLQPSDVARAVVFASATHTACTEVQLCSHFQTSRGTAVLSRALNKAAFPKRPADLRPSGPGGRPTAIVTGASQGIGLACAERLAREGYAVALVSRSPQSLDKACARLAEVSGGSSPDLFRAFPCDVGDRVAFDKTMTAILQWLGRCDVLVANAGTNRRRSMLNADWRITLSVMDTNFGHMALAANRVCPFMAHQELGGTIAFTSSRAGGGKWVTVLGDPGVAPYSGSKAALLGFATGLFHDVREHGIKVVQLCAGLVATPLGTKPMAMFQRKIDSQQMIQPEELADQLMFTAHSSPTCSPTRLVSQCLVPHLAMYRDPKSLQKPDNRELRLHSKL